MSEGKRKGGENDLVQEFKDALYTDVEQGPARLEFERRRLMARVTSSGAETRAAPFVRPLAFGFAAACAAAAAVLIALAVLPDDPAAGAESISLAGLWRARAGDAFVRGTPVRVPVGTGAKIALEDGSTLWLGSGAQLTALDEEVSAVRLDAGRLMASVAPRPSGAPFRVISGQARITVHGTVFSVTSGADQDRVRLHEGAISLSIGDEEIDVQPGHQVEVTRAGEVSLQPIDAAGVLTDLLIAERTAGLAGPVPPEIRSLASEIVMDVEVVALDPSVPEPTAPEIEVAPPPKPRQAPVRPQRVPSPPVEEVEETPAPEPREPAALVDPELAAIEVESAPAPGVIDQLRELTKQGRYADAIELADSYLAQHPRGQHADDVLYLRAHCQARTGDLRGGRQSLKDYLTRFPEGRYWDRVRDILGE